MDSELDPSKLQGISYASLQISEVWAPVLYVAHTGAIPGSQGFPTRGPC